MTEAGFVGHSGMSTSPPLQHLPPVEVLLERLHEVERTLATLDAKLQNPSVKGQARNGVLAHQASLTRKKQWYVSRIRRVRPVQPLSVGVEDEIRSGEAAL
jgi:hypothetical protein